MSKPVALILLNYNTSAFTIDCINSLKKHCDKSLFDIIVADNGSTDGSLDRFKSLFPELIYIDNQENLGFAEGNNRALSYSIAQGYTYSLLLNTDTLVDEDIVLKLSKHLDQHTEAAGVQPAIYWMHDKSKIWGGEGCFDELLGMTYPDVKVPGSEQQAGFKNSKWLSGCCTLFRNSALIDCGLLNKQFFLYYEDVELCYRIRQTGYLLHYLPGCKMYHEAGASGKERVANKEGTLNPIIHYYICRNRIWFLRGYAKTFYYPINVISSIVYYSALFVYFKLRGRNQKASMLYKGFRDGFFTQKALIWPSNK